MITIKYNNKLYDDCEKKFTNTDCFIQFVKKNADLEENYSHIFLNKRFQIVSEFVDLELIKQMIESMENGDFFYWNSHPLGYDFKIIKK
jgi:hypothetical protein